MKASLTWLKEFVEVAAEPRKLKADLTMIGLGVESFASVRGDVVLDIEVTTNRPDCLRTSLMSGIATSPIRRPSA